MKKIDWSQWFLFVIGVVVVECISIYLLWKAYPGEEMRVMGWGILILVLGFSGYATYKANEPDNTVRQVGIAGKIILALLGVASLYGHSSMSRELSTAREGYSEYQKKTVFDEGVKNQEAQRKIELAKAESDKMIAQARLEAAETGKLRLLDPSQRRATGGGTRRQPTPTPTPAPVVLTNSLVVGETGGELKTVTPRTEAAVRESWLDFFQRVNMLQILISVLSALAVNVARHWDRVGIIGVPDWLERVWHSGPAGQQYVTANFPAHAQRMQAAAGQHNQAYAGN